MTMETFFKMSNGIMVPVRISFLKTGEISFLLLLNKDDASFPQAVGAIENLVTEAEKAGVIFEKFYTNLGGGDKRPDQVRFRLLKKDREDLS